MSLPPVYIAEIVAELEAIPTGPGRPFSNVSDKTRAAVSKDMARAFCVAMASAAHGGVSSAFGFEVDNEAPLPDTPNMQ
jgi:hypothetical protein